jgi:hypothetical protein
MHKNLPAIFQQTDGESGIFAYGNFDDEINPWNFHEPLLGQTCPR